MMNTATIALGIVIIWVLVGVILFKDKIRTLLGSDRDIANDIPPNKESNKVGDRVSHTTTSKSAHVTGDSLILQDRVVSFQSNEYGLKMELSTPGIPEELITELSGKVYNVEDFLRESSAWFTGVQKEYNDLLEDKRKRDLEDVVQSDQQQDLRLDITIDEEHNITETQISVEDYIEEPEFEPDSEDLADMVMSSVEEFESEAQESTQDLGKRIKETERFRLGRESGNLTSDDEYLIDPEEDEAY